MRGVSGGVETKAAESVHVRVCGAGVRGARARAARRGPPLLCTRGAPVHLGFRRVLPRGFASVSRRAGPAPRAGHVAFAHLLATPRFFTRTPLIKHF